MTTTNFVNGVTLTDGDWFNDVDALAYEGTFPSGPSAVVVTGATTLAVFNTVATTINAFGAATTVSIGAGAASTLNANFTTAINLNTGAVVSNQTTVAVFNTTSTTVNAFGAASVALNIGNASAAAAFPGGISIPTGKTLAGAGAINITGSISGTTGAYSDIVTITNASTAALRTVRGGVTLGILQSSTKTQIGTESNHAWGVAVNNVTIGTVSSTGIAVTGILSSTGALTTNGGLQTFSANDAAGAGFRYVLVPNA